MIKQSTVNHKLQKVLLKLTSLVSVILLLIVFICFVFQMMNDAENEGIQYTERNANNISILTNSLYNSFITAFGTEEFVQDFQLVVDDNTSFEAVRYQLQNELSLFSNSNPFITSAVILNPKTKECFSLYKDRVIYPVLSDSEIENIDGITYIANKKTPYPNRENSIYVVFPLKLGQYASLAQTSADASILIVAMIDEYYLGQFLNPSGAMDNGHTFFLFTDDGTLLYSMGYDSASENVLRKVKNSLKLKSSNGVFHFIATEEIKGKGLIVVDYVNKGERFKPLLLAFGLLYMGVLITTILNMVVTRNKMKKIFTKPLNVLMEGVERIQNGDLFHPIELESGDELALLAESINLMSAKINEQFIEIQKKEELQYKIELKLLTEQLNPHFIYNTLEYIRQSILNNNPGNADLMISYLSSYLRTSLAHGRDVVEIQNEMKHTLSYVKIIENRFSHPISLILDCEEGCENVLILKSMLQPIIENSIKHGFNIDTNGQKLLNPEIEVHFKTSDDKVIIEISDNGSGFDVVKTEKIMKSELEPGLHIGLCNTYTRIKKFYGKEKADIKLISIPYYKNSFTIIIPKLDAEQK